MTQKGKSNKLILIICEGKDKGKATDPEKLVKKAAIYRKEYQIDEKTGDRVCLVFDIDINHNNNNAIRSKINKIQNAKKISDKNKIRLGISNPCFELLYLLNFEYTTANMRSYSDVHKKLSKYIKDYEKIKHVYSLLKDKIDTAINNSENDYGDISMHDFVKSNPYSNINLLIEFMEDIENK